VSALTTLAFRLSWSGGVERGRAFAVVFFETGEEGGVWLTLEREVLDGFGWPSRPFFLLDMRFSTTFFFFSLYWCARLTLSSLLV
jgi:hypothetical protein